MNKTLDFLKTITVPQAIIAVGLIAGGVAIAYRLPEDALVEAVYALVAFGVGGTLLTSRKTPERVSAPPAPPPTRTRRDGSCDAWDMVWWAVFGVGLLAALGRTGVLR